ncbi:hypothetical protein C9I89_18335 [Photobacterium lipolyticum]|uniref:Uncharacterized protein n=1 Tax=Photobacterium lipolyticum TaxID=266810 RepID=A0A2T3MTU7_9GAMM|nr:hypothetical protein C9I89_18335 [Photobacterium lipolyticum]
MHLRQTTHSTVAAVGKIHIISLKSQPKTGRGQARRQRQGNHEKKKSGKSGSTRAREELLGQSGVTDPAT